MEEDMMKDLTLTNEGTEFYKRGFHRFDTKFECPICHGHDFGSGSRTGLGGYYKTVLQCLTNAFGTPNPQCNANSLIVKSVISGFLFLNLETETILTNVKNAAQFNGI